MNNQHFFIPRLLTFAFFAVLFFSTIAAGQLREPDEQIKQQMIAYAAKVENSLAHERPRLASKSNPAEKPNPVRQAAGNFKLERNEATFEIERRAFDIINEQRILKGMEPLFWSEDMAKVARLHSENMAQHKFFGHRGLDGSLVNDRADALGISRWRSIGENIAFNRGFKKPVESACQQWMNSASHRDNILDKRWKESAIGAAIAPDGTYYFTQVFVVK